MGCYNTFVGNCPKCGEPFAIQSKVVGEELSEHSVGDRMGPEAPYDVVAHGKLELKEVCRVCGSSVVAVFNQGMLVAYVADGATKREGSWGSLADVSDFGPLEKYRAKLRQLLKLRRKGPVDDDLEEKFAEALNGIRAEMTEYEQTRIEGVVAEEKHRDDW